MSLCCARWISTFLIILFHFIIGKYLYYSSSHCYDNCIFPLCYLFTPDWCDSWQVAVWKLQLCYVGFEFLAWWIMPIPDFNRTSAIILPCKNLELNDFVTPLTFVKYWGEIKWLMSTSAVKLDTTLHYVGTLTGKISFEVLSFFGRKYELEEHFMAYLSHNMSPAPLT